MARNCIECGAEYIPFVTGNNMMCEDCDSYFTRSEDQKNKQSKNHSDDFESTMTPEELIKFEKSFHSMKFHNKFEK